MKRPWTLKYLIALLILSGVSKQSHAQLDSTIKTAADTLIHKFQDVDIPDSTFWDKMMYPHRWYVKQLLSSHPTDFDTSFILNTKRNLTLTLPVSQKYYGFNLNDLQKHERLKFLPNNPYQVGFNFSTVILTFGFAPGLAFGARPGRGSTASHDYQLTLIGRRVITDVNFQQYKGFYEHQASEDDFSLQTPGSIILRPDVGVLSFGVNTLFIFNYKKYSLRGAFSFTDVQRKSAGSFMAGFYHSSVSFFSSDSTLIRYPFVHEFSTLFSEVTKIFVNTFGVSGGYGYTYVYKKLILSAALNVGFGGQLINYTRKEGESHLMPLNGSLNINGKMAIRYDNLRFFSGLMATYDNNYAFNPGLFNTENYIGKIVFFVGYRFNIKKNGRKVLKAMGLIDYAH